MIDGHCPLCVREAAMLRRMDKGKGNLKIIDITTPDFDPNSFGTTQSYVMGSIHGVTRDGTLIRGMAVFREAYAAVGWGWLLAPTGWPVLKPLFDAFYRWFARNRLRITFRSRHAVNDPANAASAACPEGTCKVE